ncbi:MAG TPA: hypothetical protein VJ738_20715 [Steroidobacteraceae bacterium]|nr:hypothetical protein [Steroidobacteraceae bacterium]
MKCMRRLATLTVLAALAGSAFASGAALQAAPQGQAAAPPSAAPAPQGPARVWVDVQTEDTLTQEFAIRLREAIAASSTLQLAPTSDSCNLKLHVPGNLLRFDTAGAVMVSTVVIVTSSSDRYLSTSISACQASDLKPCAARAVAAAKLALLAAAQ